MAITLPPDVSNQLVGSIKRYAAEYLEQEIGDLQAALLLDYVVKEIGPSIYNKAVADAQAYFGERLADLEHTCYEKEFGYWTPPKRKA